LHVSEILEVRADDLSGFTIDQAVSTRPGNARRPLCADGNAELASLRAEAIDLVHGFRSHATSMNLEATSQSDGLPD